jgi:two-component system, sporulation sensor kinase E
MKKHSNKQNTNSLRLKLMGLGEQSFRKNYFPMLQNRIQFLERFRALLDKINDAIFLWDISANKLIDANETAHRQLGYSHDEILSLNSDNIIILENGKPLTQIFKYSDFTEGDPITLTGQLIKSDGNHIAVEVTVSMVSFDNEQYGVAVARDITERMKYLLEKEKLARYEAAKLAELERLRAEEELRESEKKYRHLVENMNEGIFIMDLNTKITFTNNAMDKMLGYYHGELIGTSFYSLLPPNDPNLLEFAKKKILNRQLGISEQYEITLMHKTGKRILTQLSASPLTDKNNVINASFAVLTDITESRKALESLRFSEERFSAAYNYNPCLMSISTLKEAKFLDVNDTFTAITGFSKESLIGKTFVESKLINDEDYDRIRYQFIKEGYVFNMETNFFTRFGEKRHGLASIQPIKLHGTRCILMTILDITEHKQMEFELANLNKMRLIGEMAAAIGHEIRNPMTTVRGFLQLISMDESDETKKAHYNLMIEELDRANTIITEYLTLSKSKTVSKTIMNLNDIINALLPLIMANAHNNDILVEVEQEPIVDLPLDEKEMRQLILNLVSNGLEAMPNGGTLNLRTYMKNDKVVFSVQNHGPEIDSKVLANLGTPFFTTKESGTGLGLAICYSIANRHNANIHVDTNPTDTTFSVIFENPQS